MNYLPPSNKMNNQVLVESRLGVHYDVLRNIYKNMDKLINIDTTLLQDDVLSTIANDLRGISWQSVINKDLGMVGVDNSNYSDIPVLRLIANNLNSLNDLIQSSGGSGLGLTTQQLEAVNSGITSSKVALYDAYDTSITSLQSDLGELEQLVNDNIVDINSINTSLGIIDSTLVTITNHIANTTIHLSTQDRAKIDNTYTKSEIDTLLDGKSDTTHNHDSEYLGINDKASSASSADSADSVEWDNITDKPSSYTPSSHTHTKEEITNFPTIPSKTSDLTNDSGFITGVSWSDISGIPLTFTPSSHTHDDRYYTEAEIDTKLSSKADSSDLSNYFPKSGGQLSGTVFRDVDNESLDLCGGTDYSRGSYIALRGQGFSSRPGSFDIVANDGSSRTSMIGKPDGSLIWGGKNIIATNVNPGALSLPSNSYTNVDTTNWNLTCQNQLMGSFTPNANGWLMLHIANSGTGEVNFWIIGGVVRINSKSSRNTINNDNFNMITIPVEKDKTYNIYGNASEYVEGRRIGYCRFMPCQGNI